MKKKALLSSILSIVLCLTMISGATFALFTDSETVNIAVTAGKVDIDVEVVDIQTKSYNKDWDEDLNFDNGGSVLYEKDQAKNELTLNLVTPGDAVKFTLQITNNSNIDVKYRTKVGLVNGVELFEGLEVTMDNAATKYNGATRVSEWKLLDSAKTEDTGVVQTVEVIIEMPYLTAAEDPTNEQSKLMDKATTMYYTVEAVQGNASDEDLDEIDNGGVFIYNAYDLLILAENMNNGNAYTEIKLMNDIDLAGAEWTPITTNGKNFTFDGNYHTISNMTTTGYRGGLIGKNNNGDMTIQNLTLKNVTMTGDNTDGEGAAGALIGWYEDHTKSTIVIDNCHVDGMNVAEFKYAGGFVGYVSNNGGTMTIQNSTVKNATLTSTYAEDGVGKGHTGGLVGRVHCNTITGCATENVQIYTTRVDRAGAICGTVTDTTKYTESNNTNDVSVTLIHKNVVNSTEALQAAIDNAEANTILALVSGVTYDVVELKGTVAKNLTIVGTEGAIVKGIHGAQTASQLKIDGLTLKNVDFQGKGLYFDVNGTPWNEVRNVTMTGCTFVGTGTADDAKGNRLFDVGGDSPSSNQYFNIVIENCTAENAIQGMRLGGLAGNGNVVRGNTITNVGHNAITLRSVNGEVLVEGNKITNAGDRALRIATNSGTVNYKNNVIVNSGDPDDGSNFKANTLGTVTFEGNTVDGAAWNPLA